MWAKGDKMLNNRVLVLDIETSPITAYVWGRKDQNIAVNQIKEDWHIMAWSAKWLNEKKIFYRDTRDTDELNILTVLWTYLNEADVVITQNGQSFDGPKINARFMIHGITPPSPYKHLDTYRIVKRVAQFTSNSLEYLTEKLCTKYRKLSHRKFPGMSLWNECLKGNREAWEEMKRYNIQDTLATEELYNKIKAWAPTTMPSPHLVPTKSNKCATCGEWSLIKEGKYISKAGVYQRYKCQKCGAWSKGEKL
jgi:DNA polymerase elongation subunit (family B)